MQVIHVFSMTVAGWLMLNAASEAAANIDSATGNVEHMEAKLVGAKYFATHILPRAQAHTDAMINSSAVALELAESNF